MKSPRSFSSLKQAVEKLNEANHELKRQSSWASSSASSYKGGGTKDAAPQNYSTIHATFSPERQVLIPPLSGDQGDDDEDDADHDYEPLFLSTQPKASRGLNAALPSAMPSGTPRGIPSGMPSSTALGLQSGTAQSRDARHSSIQADSSSPVTARPVPTPPTNIPTSSPAGIPSSTSHWTPLQQQTHRIFHRLNPPLFLMAFLLSVILPLLLYPSHHFTKTWTAFLSLLPAALCAGGAPVSGTIVFFPWMEAQDDAVAFVAAVKAIAGMLTWVAWLGWDPSVIRGETWVMLAPVGMAGCAVALLLVPFDEWNLVLWAGTVVLLILVVYVWNGLFGIVGCWYLNLSGVDRLDHPSVDQLEESLNNQLDDQWNERIEDRLEFNPIVTEGNNATVPLLSTGPSSHKLPSRPHQTISFTLLTFLLYLPLVFAGGMLTGYLGSGMEHIVFFLLTSVHRVDVTSAGITAVVLAGWVNMVAFLLHAICSPPYLDGAEEGDDDDYVIHGYEHHNDTFYNESHYNDYNSINYEILSSDPYPGPHQSCTLPHVHPNRHVPGNIPYDFLLTALPSVLLGCYMGPRLATFVGPR